MISKKLLSEVLGKECADISVENNRICFYDWSNNGASECINIHELAHKCKEWVWNKNYSMRIDQIGLMDWNIEMEDMDSGTQCFNDDFYHITEPEAIFKACEWILNENV